MVINENEQNEFLHQNTMIYCFKDNCNNLSKYFHMEPSGFPTNSMTQCNGFENSEIIYIQHSRHSSQTILGST